jgi:hypothetical protein
MWYIVAEFQDFIFLIIIVLIAIFNGIKQMMEKFNEEKKQKESEWPTSKSEQPSRPTSLFANIKPDTTEPAEVSIKEETTEKRKHAVQLAKQTAYEKQREQLRKKQARHLQYQSLKVHENEQAVTDTSPAQKHQTIATKKSQGQHASVHHEAKSRIFDHHQMAKKAVAKKALEKQLKAKKVSPQKIHVLSQLLSKKSPLAQGILYAEILNKPKALQTHLTLWS